MTIAPVIRLTLSNLSVFLHWDDTRQSPPSSIFIPLPRHVVARRSRSPLAVRACASGGGRSGRDKDRSPARGEQRQKLRYAETADNGDTERLPRPAPAPAPIAQSAACRKSSRMSSS